MNDIALYKTLIFDCDGVILDSNKIKTEAFYCAALPYGELAAQALVDYHITHGGISRYKKFAFFLEDLVPNHAEGVQGPGLEELLESYANFVKEGLLTCEVAEGLLELREILPETNWLIVSGGDQAELRKVFAERDLEGLFNGGIFGSPDTKDVILNRELSNGNIQLPALFLGDSKYDYQAAIKAGLDFVFLYNWTEVKDWKEWQRQEDIFVFENIARLFRNSHANNKL